MSDGTDSISNNNNKKLKTEALGSEGNQLSKHYHQRKTIVCFGDSLTECGDNPNLNGWVTQLRYAFSKRCDVVNRGLSGYNTKWGLQYLKHNSAFALDAEMDLVFVFFGANDNVDSELKRQEMAVQHVSLKDYRSNLMDIIKYLKNVCKARCIVLIGSPPVDTEGRIEYYKKAQNLELSVDNLPRKNQRIENYNGECRQIAVDYGCPYIDLYQKMIEVKNFPNLFCDGLHFNSMGNNMVFDLVMDAITHDKRLSEFKMNLEKGSEEGIDAPLWRKCVDILG